MPETALKNPPKPRSEKAQAARAAAEECRDALLQRLENEDESALAAKLRKCGEIFRLTCSNCGSQKSVEAGCKQKWCPVCVRRIAAMRVNKYALAVGMMQWPLFVSLTMPPHVDCDLQNLKKLKEGFRIFRRRKIWTDRVTGGVVGYEIGSRSGRFHAHCHMVIDCKWLAHFTPPPQRGDSKERIRKKCISASQELGIAWAKCIKVPYDEEAWSGTIFHVERTSSETITSEVLKYSVKGSDLLNSIHPIGDVIRAMQGTRLTSSYGSCYGRRRMDDDSKKPPRPCECCGVEAWVTDWEIEPMLHRARKERRKK